MLQYIFDTFIVTINSENVFTTFFSRRLLVVVMNPLLNQRSNIHTEYITHSFF